MGAFRGVQGRVETIMAHITNCRICGIQTCNADICGDCLWSLGQLQKEQRLYEREEILQQTKDNRSMLYAKTIIPTACPKCGNLKMEQRFL